MYCSVKEENSQTFEGWVICWWQIERQAMLTRWTTKVWNTTEQNLVGWIIKVSACRCCLCSYGPQKRINAVNEAFMWCTLPLYHCSYDGLGYFEMTIQLGFRTLIEQMDRNNCFFMPSFLLRVEHCWLLFLPFHFTLYRDTYLRHFVSACFSSAAVTWIFDYTATVGRYCWLNLD